MRLAQLASAHCMRAAIVMFFFSSLSLFFTPSILAQTTNCNITNINTTNNGSSFGVNTNTDCSPCGIPPGGASGNVGCGIIVIDLSDILGDGTVCSTIDVTPSTGSGYDFYKGNLTNATTCPTPLEIEIANNETTSIILQDTDGDGLVELTVCSDGSGNNSIEFDVQTLQCDDGDCSTTDIPDYDNCTCAYEPITNDFCDDANCATEDIYNPATCECEYTVIPPLVCDDANCATTDTYDAATCSCIYTPIDQPVCDDGDCATADSYDPTTCTCIHDPNGEQNCDDNNCSTEDSYDAASCSCIHTPIEQPSCDDGDECTTDTYNPETCDCTNVAIEDCGTSDCNVTECGCGPEDCDKKVTICHVLPGNPSNTQTIEISCNALAAHIGNHEGDYCGPCQEPCVPILCNDNNCTTADTFNSDTCECEYTLIDPVDCNDQDCTTIDSYDVTTCDCVYTSIPAPDCDDQDCTTVDTYDSATCDCSHEPISPNSCDDNDCTTTDTYNTTTCNCDHVAIDIPSCDDGDCATYDFYDSSVCECMHDAIHSDSCDDNDCTTSDTYNTTSCECEHTPITPPSCDDGDCTTSDTYDMGTCSCIHTQIGTTPECNDNDCTTLDSYDTNNCECLYTPIVGDPVCDDHDCSTEDTYNASTCNCEYTPIQAPSCDDGDCTTNDIYDSTLCDCVYTTVTPPIACNDNDCSTEDTYNTSTCECVYTPIATPDCDDHDCSTIDTYNHAICACEHNPIDASTCDDGLCYTHDYYDPNTCLCVNEPIDNTTCDDNDCATEDSYNYDTCECEHIAVCTNVEHPGEIGHSGGSCGPYDPGTIVSVSDATGGCGGIEYVWAKSPINFPFYGNDPNTPWVILDGTDDPTYTPGHMTTTMCFIRCSRTSSCDDFSGESNIVCFTIGDVVCDDHNCTTTDALDPATCECIYTPIDNPSCDDSDCTTVDTFNSHTCECEYEVICDNITDGGTIGTSQESCGPFSPGVIQEVAPPTGGCGTTEYMWVCSPVNVPFTELTATSPWQLIPGANDPTYDPGLISETKCFLRCSRKTTCEDWNGESNAICFTIGASQSCDDGDCTTNDSYNSETCDCIHESITIPSCDDNDCTTKDYYDSSTCACVNVVNNPNCETASACPEDITVSCLSAVIPENITPITNCGVEGNVTHSVPSLTGGAAGCNGAIYTIWYTITDGCGAETTCNQQVTLSVAAPTITCPADRTITCYDEIVAEVANVTTACGLQGQYSLTGPFLVSGDLGCNSSVYECIYTVTDACGQSASCSQLWTLDLGTPTIVCPADVTLSSISDYQPEMPVVSGCNYGLHLSNTEPELQGMDNGCNGLDHYTITYTVTGLCGVSSTCTQNIYIENGCNAPTITCPPDRTITCLDEITIETPVTTVPCGNGIIDVQGPTLVSGDQGCMDSVYECIYIVTDPCGQTASCTQQWTLNIANPTISCPADVTVDYLSEYTIGDPVVTGCLYALSVYNDDPILTHDGGGCSADIYNVVYTASNVCQEKVTCTQTVTVESNICGVPTITCPSDKIVTCFSDIVIETPQTNVPCGSGVVSVDGPNLVSGSGGCSGSVYECIYNVVDACGQSATCTQTWTLRIQAPTMTCPADDVITNIDQFIPGTPIINGCAFGATIANSSPSLIYQGNGCDNDIYEVTYTLSNVCGGSATCTQNISVEAGITCDIPTISCPEDRTVTCVDDIVVETPTMNVPCNGGILDVDGPTLVSGSGGCDGSTYECIYTVTDKCGQTASCTQLWTLDILAPVITCPADVTLSSIDDFSAGDVTIYGCNYGLTITNGQPNLESTGSGCNDHDIYTVEYTVSSLCGYSKVCSQKVYVIAGVLCDAPTITCPVDRTITCIDDIVAEVATIEASCGGESFAIDGPTLVSGNQGCMGAVYECIYTVTDQCGQTASCQQLWTLDIAAPTITCPADITIDKLSNFIPGHVSIGGCEYGVTVNIGNPILVTERTGCNGNGYHVDYTATNLCGQSVTCTQTVTVNEYNNTPPYVKIGDYVWSDLNADGIQNDGPMSIVGVDGVIVNLLDANGNAVTDYNGITVGTEVTTGGGKYCFEYIIPGDYKIKFTAPSPTGTISTYNWSNANNGNDDSIDSDVHAMTGTNMAMTDVFTVVCGYDDLSIDAGVIATLPVELQTFEGTFNEEIGANEILWEMATEIGMESYEVEKSFGNADAFEMITTQVAKGKKDGEIAYSVLDKDLQSGTYYYRLKMINLEGGIEYSGIIAIDVNMDTDDHDVDIYPNPSDDRVYIDIKSFPEDKIEIDLFDLIGNKIKTDYVLDRNHRLSTTVIPVNDLNAGNYLLRIKVGQSTFVERITVLD